MNYEEYMDNISTASGYFESLEPPKQGDVPDMDWSVKMMASSGFRKIIIRQLKKYDRLASFLYEYTRNTKTVTERECISELAGTVVDYICDICSEIGINPEIVKLYRTGYDKLSAWEMKSRIDDEIDRHDIVLPSDFTLDESFLISRELTDYDKICAYRNIVRAKQFTDRVEDAEAKDKLEQCLFIAYKRFCSVHSKGNGIAEEQWISENEYKYRI